MLGSWRNCEQVLNLELPNFEDVWLTALAVLLLPALNFNLNVELMGAALENCLF